MARERVPQTWGKAKPKQCRKGKYMLCTTASIGVMLLNMQITFMMAERIDHIQRLLIRSDDLRLAKRHPDVSRMDIHIGSSLGVKIFGVILSIGRLDAYVEAPPIRGRGGAISPSRGEGSRKHKIIQIRQSC